MKTLEKVSDFVGKYMAAIVIVVAALSLLFPGTFSVVKTAWVNTLLGIVMFGMGLTLKPEDFKVVFSRPKDVIIGCIAQFTLMPFLAWALTQLFHLPTELAIGVILVGTCPGGTSSNVMTYLSKGDVALSVGMTAVSTVLAPILTPLLRPARGCEPCKYVPVHRQSSAGAHRTGLCGQPLLPRLHSERHPRAAAGLHHRHRAHHLRRCFCKLRQDHDQRPADPCRSHPAQPAGLPHRLRCGQAAEAGFHQVPRDLHRGRYAELRSGHLSGRCPLCTVSAGNHPRRCVLGVA